MPGVHRPLIGIPDGVTLVFETPADYRPGSVRVFRNGQLQRQDWDNGWEELGGKFIKLKSAPKVGDDMQAYFDPL